MKLFTASLGTETNTFSPFVTSEQDFENTYLTRAGQHGDDPFIFALPLLAWRERASARGWQVVESLCTFAQPSGVTLRSVYERYRDEILHDLRQAMPVDMVLLSLHGAMVADGYDDCEGDLLACVRAIVGPDTPIGVELDPHCHLTQSMVENATVIVTFKEYPHIDIAERAHEVFTIAAAVLEGRARPHMHLHDCKMIGVFHTSREPMRSFVARMRELEGRNDILSISLAHGFPWGDVADMGTRVLVITDDRPLVGATLAQELGDWLFARRVELQPPYLTVDQALDEVLQSDAWPVVLADVSDNAGGGASSDSTFLLRALIERGVGDAALAAIWDPVVVGLAMDAGVGARFPVRLGGKMGPASGDPLDAHAEVLSAAHNVVQTFGAGKARMGDAVALRIKGVDVVVNSKRTQIFHPDAFTSLGIDPAQKRVVVVKSMQHFFAGFAPIAAAVHYVAAPGALTPYFDQLPYRQARRNIWPISDAVQPDEMERG